MDIESPIAPCMLLHYLVKHYCQQNKPLKTSPHLKYVATLHCNLLLMACFKSSVATYARCGGTNGVENSTLANVNVRGVGLGMLIHFRPVPH